MMLASTFLIGILAVPSTSALLVTGPIGPTVECAFEAGGIACRICGPEEGDYLLQPYLDRKYGASVAYNEVYYGEQCDGMDP